MQSFIITLTGASGCGKTYVMDKISEASIKLEKIGLVFKPKRIKKQTTRNYRIEEIIEIIDGKIDNIDVESVVKLDDDCDLVYQTYGKKYGLKLSVLENALKNNECPVVIINDVRVVEELKKKFPNRVLSLYIFREIPNYDKLKKLSSGRGAVSNEEVRGRFNKAVAMHRTYIENITLFDKVILNIKKIISKVVNLTIQEFKFLTLLKLLWKINMF
ncbi:MAG: hypothetical protein E7183_06550 [Erysipelotrichaceae bacterium]|nr:hypothetical protein [Erysipelotrichaceae bacterium]